MCRKSQDIFYREGWKGTYLTIHPNTVWSYVCKSMALAQEIMDGAEVSNNKPIYISEFGMH